MLEVRFVKLKKILQLKNEILKIKKQYISTNKILKPNTYSLPYELPKEIKEVLQIQRKASESIENGPTVRIAGGWVRDILRPIQNEYSLEWPKINILQMNTIEYNKINDIDVVVDTMTGIEYGKLLKKYCNTNSIPIKLYTVNTVSEMSKHLQPSRIILKKNFYIDIVNLRKEIYTYKESRVPSKINFGTPKDDSIRRDFTINALYYNIHTQQIEDWQDGQCIDDIIYKRIRTTNKDNTIQIFIDDPLRIYRAIRFSLRFNYVIDKTIIDAAEDTLVQEAQQYKLSRERIYQEINLILYNDIKSLDGYILQLIYKLIDLSIFHNLFSLQYLLYNNDNDKNKIVLWDKKNLKKYCNIVYDIENTLNKQYTNISKDQYILILLLPIIPSLYWDTSIVYQTFIPLFYISSDDTVLDTTSEGMQIQIPVQILDIKKGEIVETIIRKKYNLIIYKNKYRRMNKNNITLINSEINAKIQQINNSFEKIFNQNIETKINNEYTKEINIQCNTLFKKGQCINKLTITKIQRVQYLSQILYILSTNDKKQYKVYPVNTIWEYSHILEYTNYAINICPIDIKNFKNIYKKILPSIITIITLVKFINSIELFMCLQIVISIHNNQCKSLSHEAKQLHKTLTIFLNILHTLNLYTDICIDQNTQNVYVISTNTWEYPIRYIDGLVLQDEIRRYVSTIIPEEYHGIVLSNLRLFYTQILDSLYVIQQLFPNCTKEQLLEVFREQLGDIYTDTS